MNSLIKTLLFVFAVAFSFSFSGCSSCNRANDDTEYQPINAPIAVEPIDTVETRDEAPGVESDTESDTYTRSWERLRQDGFPVYESNRLTNRGGGRSVPFWAQVIMVYTYDDKATISAFFEENGGSAKPIDEIPGYSYTVNDPIEVTGWKYPIYIYSESEMDYNAIMYLLHESADGRSEGAYF